MRLSFAAAATAAIALLSGSAAAAPVIGAGLYQERVYLDCTGKQACSIPFTPVPAARTLVVSDVGCSILVFGATSVAQALITGTTASFGSIGRTAYIRPLMTEVAGTARRFMVQDEVKLLLLSQERPVVTLVLPAKPSQFMADCTITGYLR